MASSKTGNQQRAEQYLAQLRKGRQDKMLREKFAPHASSPYEVAEVAENILLATIRFNQQKHNEAILAIKQAILAEDSLLYSEPKLWMMPARQYSGVFFMKMNKPAEAEKVYREDLHWNQGNGWSLLGLYQSLKAQGKTKELSKLKKQYTISFSAADELPTTSAY
jgi:hypothetical protein